MFKAIAPLILTLQFFAVQFFGFGGDSSHFIYTFPNGYVGWVRITTQVPFAKDYTWTRNGKNVRIDFDDTGTYITSGVSIEYTARPQFFYVSRLPDGKEKLTPLPENYIDRKDNVFGGLVYGQRGVPSWMFFVGPPDMREKYAWHGAMPDRSGEVPPGSTWGPTPGRIAKTVDPSPYLSTDNATAPVTRWWTTN